MTYFLTFSCYGARLHGDEDGSVDRNHNLFGARVLPPNRKWEAAARRRMTDAPYHLDAARRRIVLQTITEVCSSRNWILLAAQVRTTHVHVILDAPQRPEQVMTTLKSYASRALNESGIDGQNRDRWSRHGSTRYLWNHQQINRAVVYVADRQGEPMDVTEPRP